MTNTQVTPAGAEPRKASPKRFFSGANKTLIVFIVFVQLLAVVGYSIFQHYKDRIKNEKQAELGAIAELKIRQITTWMTERRGDAHALRGDPIFVDAVGEWLRLGGRDNASAAKLVARLSAMQQAYASNGYRSIALFDAQGILRLSSTLEEEPIYPTERMRLLESMRSGEIVFSDIHKEQFKSGERIEIELIVPLTRVKNGRTQRLGVILFRIDPYRFIFPLIQRWPTPSASAENLLVQRKGGEVVFLNELRHRKNSALEMRMPLSQAHLPAAMAVLGLAGMVEGVDYRGVPVVGVLNKVIGTPWFMVSKIDKKEIEAPINHLADQMLLLLLFLVGASGGMAVFWRTNEKKQFVNEVERRQLTRRLNYLMKYANDIILQLNSLGEIIDFNDRALQAYGYSAAEFLKLNIDDLLVAEHSRPHSERVKQIDSAGGAMLFESEHVRKDGTKFPIESSVRVVEIEGQKLYQAIIRDISERKLAEQELAGQKKFIRQIIDSDPSLIFVKDAEGRFLLANAAMAKLYGQTTAGIIGKTNSDFVEDAQLTKDYERANREVIESRQERIAIEVGVPTDGKTHWFKTLRKPLEQDDGSVSVLTIAVDITELKQSEIKLAESYKRLQWLSMHLENIRVDERAKIALNLHDEMGATLVAIKMSVAWLAPKLAAGEPQLAEEVARISELVTGGIQTMRRIVTQLHPSLPGDVGLEAAIKDQVNKFRQLSNVECMLVLPEQEFTLNAEQAITVFRILQESLNNVVKHARANRVEVLFTQHAALLSMVIKDNGIGFDLAAHKEQAFGLLGIKERALMVGGKARISSTPGKGTRVSLTIPNTPLELSVS
ncbi:MAG: PAS domain S-box protein [Gallionellaceae bacterium]|jgi:PAS domain S-box-containing protein